MPETVKNRHHTKRTSGVRAARTVLLVASTAGGMARLAALVGIRLEEFSVVTERMSARKWTPALARRVAEFAARYPGAPVIVVEPLTDANAAGRSMAAQLSSAMSDGLVLAVTSMPVRTAHRRSNAQESPVGTVAALEALLRRSESGSPVGFLALGEAGAHNAALSAVAILALKNADLRRKLKAFRRDQCRAVRRQRLPAP